VTIVGDTVKINSGGSPGTGTNIEPLAALLPGESPKPKQEKFKKDDDALMPAATPVMSGRPQNWGMNMDEYVKFGRTENCKAQTLQDALDESLDPKSKAGKAMAEMQKAVDAKKTTLEKARAAEKAVNRRVKYISDIKQYNQEDYWALPGETLTSGKGDCEDYAIVKYKLLANSGVRPEDMEILTVTDPNTPKGPAHAILHVREDTGMKNAKGEPVYKHYLLDNNRPLGAEANIDQSKTHGYTVRQSTTNEKCYTEVSTKKPLKTAK
jgi:predicted transglutaminase-like cysteine proteinase